MEDTARHGWVKLHRKLLDNPRFTDGDTLKVWTACLLLATHKPYRMIFGGAEITLQPGQFITSQKSLNTLTRVEPSKIERVLRELKTNKQIDKLGSNRSRLITVLNWAEYQGTDKPSDKALTSHRQTSDNKQEWEELKDSFPSEKNGGIKGSNEGSKASSNMNPKQDPPATPRKPGAPDPIWESLCEAFGLKPVSKEEKARIGKVATTLKAKGATPEKVRLVYAKMKGEGWSPFSPEGLVKWFDQLSIQEPRKTPQAPEDVYTPDAFRVDATGPEFSPPEVANG